MLGGVIPGKLGVTMRLLVGMSIALMTSTAAFATDLGPVAKIEQNPALVELGKRLFYDSRLSGDTNFSCSTCHDPAKGFTDGEKLSTAYTGSEGFRNTPTLANVGHRAAWMHDSRLGTNLNDVSRGMITETYIMNMDMRVMQERLKQDPVYVEMFKAAGKGEPSNGGARGALEAFLKSITSTGSAFDEGKLSLAEKRGYELFKGKAGCSSCHSGNRFTDDQPHNIGVPNNPDIWSDPMRHITYVTYAKFMGVNNYMNLREDQGAYILDHKEENKRSFMTPSLRELTYTAPYMHNGMLASLEEVVEFYNQGGGDDVNKDARLKPLRLKDNEKANLVAFLKSLSGNSFDTPEYVWTADDYSYELIEDWKNKHN
ncbi:Cytochrome c551 peroxidase precursor [Pseudovibrio axinellae]|uniref:Cytochrome c551 peroxidase n=2 Tax=Pseudovibrio axinellae TaxID=989403 RepID=A0A165T0Q4_9HYPH|nr:Cytochrome c551 peroxidase precursor [Pseudovibrio axinellae]SER49443.1 cytochrome c peroxidase [Pseudovibrio axinellae]